ncbi:aldo/keto reductase [Desulfovibrio sp. OttesenSCG-928-C06]|nr:aldo/keto reductase [Desulfovibrio sp. OttesenSCG-928-C06]
METIKIKGLDKPVTRMILGSTWWWRHFPEKTVFETLDAYVEAGGNMLDTGRFYSAGHGEKVLAKWFDMTGMRGKIMVTSKACHHYVDEDNNHFPEKNRVQPECITEDLEFSLNRLGLDHFEVFMMHRDRRDLPVGEMMDVLEKHHKEGKINAYGVSNWDQDRLQEAIDYCKSKGYQGPTTNSPSYSLATVTAPRWAGCSYIDDDYAAWHKGTDVAILSWASQGGGWFGEAHKRGELPKDYFDAYDTPANNEKMKRCRELAAEKGANVLPINIALAYLLNQNLPIAAIVGPRDANELKTGLKGLDIKLTPAEVEYLSLRSDKR